MCSVVLGVLGPGEQSSGPGAWTSGVVATLIVELVQEGAHRVDPPVLLIVGLHHDRRGQLLVRRGGRSPALPRRSPPSGPRFRSTGDSFDCRTGSIWRRRETRPLLVLRHREPDLGHGSSALHQHPLEPGRLIHEGLVVLVGAETHDPLDSGPVVLTAVEQHHLSGGRQVLHVTLAVPPPPARWRRASLSPLSARPGVAGPRPRNWWIAYSVHSWA